ncbi:MAG: cytochrome c biogenesis heme-transporting ATPase CcmA [Zoogloeaceae bacterium]|jgi:heme exporter protein A|nr:cytochrome c biogenesis heme-transporting ATPase CcmA [Zoogloeaceae bacterium]
MLEADNLECTRGEQRLFQGLEFRLGAGELLFLKGENGAGKTSLLRMICGLLPPGAGEIRWQGENIHHLAGDYRAAFCYLGHANAIKEELTPLENLRCAAALAGTSLPESLAFDALAQVGLADRADLACRYLSQGQKRRVALARLVCDNRALWVLDEPFVALDARAVAWLRDLIGAHVAAGGLTVMTTHQPVDMPSVQTRELRLAA